MQSLEVVSFLKAKKIRITEAREAIVGIVFSEDVPVSAAQILVSLKKQNKPVNKTTVYRELSFLVKESIFREVFLTAGTVHYESAMLPHHHHLVCKNCERVEEVDCVINEASLLKKATKKGFVLENHKFELYGICVNCK